MLNRIRHPVIDRHLLWNFKPLTLHSVCCFSLLRLCSNSRLLKVAQMPTLRPRPQVSTSFSPVHTYTMNSGWIDLSTITWLRMLDARVFAFMNPWNNKLAPSLIFFGSTHSKILPPFFFDNFLHYKIVPQSARTSRSDPKSSRSWRTIPKSFQPSASWHR